MYRRILIVVSDRPEAQAAIRHGLELARVHVAEVFFLAVLPPIAPAVADVAPVMPLADTQEAERALRQQGDELIAKARQRADAMGVPSEGLLSAGVADAVGTITTTASERYCDLIVTGTEQRNAVMRILTGSVVPGLITRAPVPVLVCHQSPDGTD